MINIEDIHNHTIYSDGDHTPEEIIENALKHGLDIVGISDHNRALLLRYPNYQNFYSYLDELKFLKNKYKNNINVLTGIELNLNFESEDEEGSIPFDKFDCLDYVLFEHVDGTAPYKAITKYCVRLKDLSRIRKKVKCQAGLAHTDLLQLSQIYSEDKGIEYGMDSVIAMLKEYDLFWEINVCREHGYFDYILRNRDRYEVSTLFRKLRDNSIRMRVGSDTHYLKMYDSERVRLGNFMMIFKTLNRLDKLKNMRGEEGMERLLKELKKRCGNNSIRFTQSIDFSYDDKQRIVYLIMKKGIRDNVQIDSAAFEAWALVLKANLDDLVSNIILDWDSSMEPKERNTDEWRHFNRFLYRVYTFTKKYSEWFSVSNQKESWKDRIVNNGWNKLVLNSSGNRIIKNKIKGDGFESEHELEAYFTGKGSERLRQAIIERFNIKLGEIRNQYPIGIFNNVVSSENYVFTGGKSAIDLYSIEEGKSFNIFELKGEGNIKVGILSELFFYSSLIKDTMKKEFISESDELEGISKVNAFFLVPRMHPLITDKVINLLNSSGPDISYKSLKYRVSNIDFPID